MMILDLKRLMSQEEIDLFNMHAQVYVVTFWLVVEEKFLSFGEDKDAQDKGAKFILATPLYLFMCMVIRDYMAIPAGEKFFLVFKDRKLHKKFYAFLESDDLHHALVDLGKEWRNPSMNDKYRNRD